MTSSSAHRLALLAGATWITWQASRAEMLDPAIADLPDQARQAAASLAPGPGASPCASDAAPNIPPSSDPPSTHGMLLFGRERFYVSHLPMFHSPHDYQAILEVEIDPASRALLEADRAANPGRYHTIVPESMVLPDVVRERRSFRADIASGHFERGGQTIGAGIQFQIKRVVYFKKFRPTDPRPTASRQVLFGTPDDAYVAHDITRPPDFDQISQVSVKSQALRQRLATETSVPLDIPGTPDTTALTSGQPVSVQPRTPPGAAPSMLTPQTIYTERGDLE